MYKYIYINLEYIDISFTLFLKHIIKLHFQDFITPFTLETAQILEDARAMFQFSSVTQ